MDMELKKPAAIMMMGRPGAGKDTQAKILADKMGLIRVVTSDLLQKKLNENPDDPDIKKEKEIFESGVLNTPSWVLSVIKEYIEKLAKTNFNGKNGVIFSGSPRTSYEVENLIPFIEKIFGLENIFALYLEISEEVGIERIIKRNKENPRSLDEGPEKLKTRTREFDVRTRPVLDYLEKMGILIRINGMPPAEDVAAEIAKKLSPFGRPLVRREHYK